MLFAASAANPQQRRLSQNDRPLLIAEFGLNHNRDRDLARRMVDAACKSGADAIKLQSYTTRYFINRHFADMHPLYDIFSALETDFEFHLLLRDHAVAQGLMFFSTPLTEDWVERLEQLAVPVYKIASGDINNFPLLRKAAATQKPLIVSTGAANAEEIERAITFLEQNATDYAILHCVSLYPTPLAKSRIGRITALRQLVPENHLLGFSDHTIGSEAAFAAVIAGARIIEKHFTLDKSLPGPDQKMSADPQELAALRTAIDLAHAIWGDANSADCHPEERAHDYFGKRSLYEFEGRQLAMRPRHPDYPPC
ncbi:MAG: N-acetylneuraminate synthase family protein [Turneriella sp.]|nr:N-acetylneuraminate synthase family protein [Turneriella sp.]